MSHGTDATVECPLCGAAFDPSVSGGYCTEPECGSQHVAGATSAGRRLVADGGRAEDAHADDGTEESDDVPDVAAIWPDSDDSADDDGQSATGDDGSDEVGGPVADMDEGDEAIACPACETEVAAGDNFCRVCGADVSGIDDSGELTSCPSCETAVEPEDRFCRECGEHLEAHRPGTDASAPTGVTGRAQGGAPADSLPGAGVDGRADSADAGGTGAGSTLNAETVKLGGSGANATAAADGTDAEPEEAGPRLSLVARNREVTVGDGDTVGKEIRSIIMDTGGGEEDAVRVHREHVRFEHEGGQFYLVDLGRNSTVVNGKELEQGDRVPVEPGDRIDLSGVARIGVRQA